ncbi:peptide-methionine (S)-S-oxide reductase MsrA [Massilia sp. PWRC2]|uniref:peptide-methionine (S)-S-oxide reductase MsrA n=1 Tax=Massilia sp. PWRC2 TaxID=2804626 RepID=UPI003CE6C85A
MTTQMEVAFLGSGCFWCLEAVYQQARGVTSVESGYMGGQPADPAGASGQSGTSGHAQVVRLEFDAAVISYRDLLEVFFTLYDPTTLNRQGKDVGSQYRSVIFTTTGQQAEVARHVAAAMAAVWDAPIVTGIAPASSWYKAEAAQQNYCSTHPDQSYCALVVEPKVIKFRQIFARHAR